MREREGRESKRALKDDKHESSRETRFVVVARIW